MRKGQGGMASGSEEKGEERRKEFASLSFSQRDRMGSVTPSNSFTHSIHIYLAPCARELPRWQEW